MRETLTWAGFFLLSLAGAPLLVGIIAKVKAFFAGRCGVRLCQQYCDLAKLARKNAVYSSATSGVFRLAPALMLGAVLGAALLMPFAMRSSPLTFAGDVVLFFYLLGLGRFALVLGALDTGSSFEGMGASREMQFAALAEMVIFAILGFLVLLTGRNTVSAMLNGFGVSLWGQNLSAILLAAGAFFVVLLMENGRVPCDDPETHLELTMIHEAMILDYSGLDLAMILYASNLKLWLFASFLTLLALPVDPSRGFWLDGLFYLAGVLVVTLAVGVAESIMARYRFLKVPQLLIGALTVVLTAVTLLVIFKRGF